MKKAKAILVHVTLSLVLALPLIGLIRFAWFPGPWFETQAVLPLLALLLGIHLVVAPALTALVYRPGKKGLVFDLVVIGALQLAALGYGAWTVHSERPRWAVFAVDRFVPLAAKDVDFAAAGVEATPTGFRGPRYVFAEMPMGDAFQRFQDSVLFGGRPDLDRRPEFWRDFDTDAARAAVLDAARPLADLRTRRPDADEALVEAARRQGLDPDAAPWVPLMGKRQEFAALLDAESARVLGVVAVDPWLREP